MLTLVSMELIKNNKMVIVQYEWFVELIEASAPKFYNYVGKRIFCHTVNNMKSDGREVL
jgi:hypothetical protein